MDLVRIAARVAVKHGLDPLQSLKSLPDEWTQQTIRELHGLMPFVAPYDNDLPLSVLSWVSNCEKKGLITYPEYNRILREVKRTEGIYD